MPGPPLEDDPFAALPARGRRQAPAAGDDPFSSLPSLTAKPIEATPPAGTISPAEVGRAMLGMETAAGRDVTRALPTPVPERPAPPPTPKTVVPGYVPPQEPAYDRFGEQSGTRPVPRQPGEPLGISATEEPGFIRNLISSAGEAIKEKYRYQDAAPGAPSAMPRREREAERQLEQVRTYGGAEGRSPAQMATDVEQDIVDLGADEGGWAKQIGHMAGDFVDPLVLASGVAGEKLVMAALEQTALKAANPAARLLARRVLRLANTPEGATLQRRLIARATHGLVTGGPINVAATTATAAEEGRLPTVPEVLSAGAAGAALGPAFEVAGGLAHDAMPKATREAPRPPAAPDFNAMASEARDLSLVPREQRTPVQQARLDELHPQLVAEGERMAREEPPPPVAQSALGAQEPVPAVRRLTYDEIFDRHKALSEEPGTIYRIPTQAIVADPARFQFKNLGTQGVSAELKGVTRFNDQLAGVISVWRDPADGQVYVVNGHHRLELAQRTGKAEMNVQFINAPTAEAARAEGAFINIAEGRGTAIDVAKFLRDRKATPQELADRGVTLSGPLSRDGLALARLAPDVFDQVATAQVPQGWGVAIGSMLDDPVLQREALVAVRGSGKRLNQAEVVEVARQVRDAGTEGVNQETLFGSEEERRGLFVQRAQLAAAVKKRLAGDKRLFGYVAREGRAEELSRAGGTQIDVEAARGIAEGSARSEEVFDRLYTRSGPLATLMNEGARRIARGEKPSTVLADIYPAVGDAVSAEVSRGGGGVEPHVGERAVPPGARAPADEAGAPPDAGRVADSQDPGQPGMFSPGRSRAPERRQTEPQEGARASATPPGPPGAPRRPPSEGLDEPALLSPRRESQGADLFGNAPPPVDQSVQESLFGEKAGTAGSRSLAQTEAAARSEIEVLRQRFAGETDLARKGQLAAQIVEREKLLNRGGAIGAEELRTRAAAEGQAPVPTGPDQMAMFSPAPEASPLASKLQPGGAKPDPAEAADVKALIDISRGLADAVNVPLRQGRFRAAARRAVGVFFPHKEVTRVVRFDKLDTVAHEVGHYLSKKYLRNPTMTSANFRGQGRLPTMLPKEAARELVQMGRDLYGDRKPAGGYGEEGIAEWASFYVTDPTRMQAKAPVFTAHMDGILAGEPALRAALDQARADFARYQASPPSARVAAMLSVDERSRFQPSAKWLMKWALDDVYEFKSAVDDLGKSVSPERDAYILSRLTRGNAGVAEEMLVRGVPKYGTRERAAPSVEDAIKSIPPERLQAFREYLAAWSARDRWERGIDPGIAKGDAEAIANAPENRKEFGEAAGAVWDHYRALIEYRRDAGLLTPEAAKRILDANPHHVAFYRVFSAEEAAAGGGGSGRGYARSSSGVKGQKGSARRIIDPLESVFTDTYQTVDQVRKYEVARELVQAAIDTEGGGRIAEEVPAPQQAVNVPIEKVRDQLADLGFSPPGGQSPAEWISQPEMQDVLRFFQDARSAGAAESKDLVIPILKDGERKWYAIKDRDLFNAMQGLGTPEVAGWMRWLSAPVRTLRAGATLTLEFAFGRNPVRDAWSSSVYSRASYRPPFWRLTEGLFHYLKADDAYQAFRLEGGENATQLGLDRVGAQHTLDRLLATKSLPGRAWTLVRHPIDTLRLVSAATETATRVGEAAAVERELIARGTDPKAAGKLGALAGRDITIDFAQGGVAAKAINQIVWTFNAALRGTAQLARELRERPGTVIPRAIASITLPSLALYYMQKDDPAYQDVPAWVKNTAWVWVQRGIDRGEGWDGYGTGKVERVWYVPKPFELGVVFGTVPERMAEWLEHKNPESLRQMRAALTQAFVPPIVPTAVSPLIENYANRSFFRDRPIVPRAREGLDPAQQYGPGTGETFRLLGQTLGMSPAKIENLVRGYTGGLGRYATDASDAAIRQGRKSAGLPPLAPERDIRRSDDPFADLPFTRAFVRHAPGEDAESIERLYQRYESAERRRQTWRKLIAEGKGEEASAYLQTHREEIVQVATREETGSDPGPLRARYEALTQLQQAKRQLGQGGGRPEDRERVVRAVREVARLDAP